MRGKPHISEYNRKLSKTLTAHRCKGCGRVIPRNSWVQIWSVWFHRKRHRWHLCSDCQKIIYACDTRRQLSHEDDALLVRGMCQSCDDFPFCDKVNYIRNTVPDDLYLGDVDRDDMWEERDGSLFKR